MKYSLILGVIFALGIGTIFYQMEKQEQHRLRMQVYLENLPKCDMSSLTSSIKHDCMRDNGYAWFVPRYIYKEDVK